MKSSKLVIATLLASVFVESFVCSEAYAFEKYTWSELVTGKRQSVASTKEDNRIITEWCGLERIVDLNNNLIANSTDANDKLYKTVMKLRYNCIYGLKDREQADKALNLLEETPELANKLKAEKIISSLTSENFISDKSYEKLLELKNLKNVLPYDNGYLPVVTVDKINEMIAVRQMIDGRGTVGNGLKMKCWKGIPSSLLFKLATDQKNEAMNDFQNVKANLESPVAKLISDFMQPLYMRANVPDRKFLAGLICSEDFPNLSMKLINESLTSEPRLSKPEHALASLSDLYNKHNAYGEAQQVWKLLTELYPDSIWLK